MSKYQFSVGSGTPSVVEGDLTWFSNGSLANLLVTDPLNSADAQSCSFGYDDLSRLTKANCGSAWSQTFSFDPFGNASKSGTGTFQPGWDLTKNWFLPTTGFDNNGNLKTDVAHTYTWDAENKLTSVDAVNLTFDALGRMVEQARGSSYTQIVYSAKGGKLALMGGQTLQRAFVALPGGGTAVYNASGLAYYRHSDWLGTSRLATLPTQTNPAINEVYFDGAYAPYGENYSGYGTSDLDFTGQNQDTVGGLHDFLYREYQPSSSRWIQPDPAGLGAVSIENPQTWNRYAYVTNNPLNAIDPAGLWRSDVFGSGKNGDDFRDVGGAWFAAQIQEFQVEAGLLDPMQEGLNSYVSWVNAIQQNGGSTKVVDGKTYTIDWSMDGGAFWRAPNGDNLSDLSPESFAEIGLSLLAAVNKGSPNHFAITNVVWTRGKSGPPTCIQGLVRQVCFYEVVDNCTADTSPPDNSMTGENVEWIAWGWNDPTQTYMSWNVYSYCKSANGHQPWHCSYGYAGLVSVNASIQPQSCTHNP